MKRVMLWVFVLLVLAWPASLLAVKWLSPPPERLLAPAPAKPAPCPQSPNCVFSLAKDPAHQIAPLALSGDPARAQERLAKIIAGQDGLEIAQKAPGYLWVVCKTPVFRFRDDLEFWFDGPAKLIQVRSASRLGYSDLSANRRRVEKIRALWLADRP